MQGEELGNCAQKPQGDIMQSSCVLHLEFISGSGSYFLGSSDLDPTPPSELTSFKGIQYKKGLKQDLLGTFELLKGNEYVIKEELDHCNELICEIIQILCQKDRIRFSDPVLIRPKSSGSSRIRIHSTRGEALDINGAREKQDGVAWILP